MIDNDFEFNFSSLESDIRSDRVNIFKLLNQYSNISSIEKFTNEIASIHTALYLYRTISNDAFYVPSPNDKNAINLATLNMNLLINSLLSIIKGETYIANFLFRGSLETIVRAIMLKNGYTPEKRFATNLEQIIKKIKLDILSKQSFNLTTKRQIKSTLNQLSNTGVHQLYGKLSEYIHIRDLTIEKPSDTLKSILISTAEIDMKTIDFFKSIIYFEISLILNYS